MNLLRQGNAKFQFLEGFGKIHGYAERNIYLLPMLMYGKEASNRKQKIDASTTLFRTKEAKDQKTNIMEMCITGYGIMDNSIHSTWKS